MIDDEMNSYIRNFYMEDSDFIDSNDGEDTFKYTYGTTPFSTFEKIVLQIKRPKRFIVLGSGTGAQCVHWNRLFPDIPTIGYEIHDVRYDFSVYLAEKYNLKNIELYNESLIDADIQDGDLIWENNLCIPSDICDTFNLMALKKENIGIVSYSPILRGYQSDGNILMIDDFGQIKGFSYKTLNLPTSWNTRQSFYIL
jgi:hypothetical protein